MFLWKLCCIIITYKFTVYNNMHRQILGYNWWDSANFMFVNNAIDSFDVVMRKNIYGLKKCIFTIYNHLIKAMYNCTDIVNME